MKLLFFRFQEWMAERFSSVQYPRQTFIPKQPRQPFFKYEMPWPQRMLLAWVSLFMIIVGIIGLAFVLLVFWCIFSTIFNW